MLGKLFFRRKSVEARAEDVRDAVFGIMDGMVDTIATIAGVYAATGNVFIVFIAGLSTLVAEAASMGFGSYLSTRVKTQFLRSKRRKSFNRPFSEAILYLFATLSGGLFILIPFALNMANAFYYSALLAFVLLFSLGYFTARLTKLNPIKSGLEIAAFGIIASAVTYIIGSYLSTAFGVLV